MTTKRQKHQPSQARCSLLLTPSDVLFRGLGHLKVHVSEYASVKTKTEHFKAHFGCSTRAIAALWHDLTKVCAEEGGLLNHESNEEGFRMILLTLNFLWDLPKNAHTFGQRWRQCERNSRGEPLWYWIRKIAAMKSSMIYWEQHLNDPEGEVFVCSADGTDFRTREKSSKDFNKDPKQCSFKSRHAALRYEIAISVRTGRIIWINGPFRGAESEITIYKDGLAKKIADGKLCIVDGGYGGCPHVSMPNLRDPKEVRRFKALIRCRHEGLNGRLKGFGILQQMFRYESSKHAFTFEAVCVMQQYQLENGNPLFDI